MKREMKRGKRLFWPRILGLLAVLLAVVAGAASYVRGPAGDIQHAQLQMQSLSPIESQAWQVAAQVVGGNHEAQEQFAVQLVDLYNQVKNYDMVIFCAPGGWGKRPMETDMQADSWLVGIESVVVNLGYKYYEVEDIRTGTGLWPTLLELKEQLTHYPQKARELSAEIDFLTNNVAGLKVIVAGQSNGAGFAGEVVNRLQANPNVFSVQVGMPFWHRVWQNSRSLIITENGLTADTLTRKNIPEILKNNWLQLFVLNKVPAFTPLDWLVTRAFLLFGPYSVGITAPGHDYMWEYPGVGPVIQAFLERNFGAR